MAKVLVSVEMPEALVQKFLQWVRDFDTKHDPNHEDKIKIAMLVQADKSVDEMLTTFNSISPGFPYTEFFKKAFKDGE
jgi:hypothetical protein